MIDEVTISEEVRRSVDPFPPANPRHRVRALLLLTTVAVAVVVVVELTTGGHARPTDASTTVAPRSATADFALLRSVAAEPLPHAYLRFVQRATLRYDLMPSGARESRSGVWLIPGHNGLCIAMVDSEGPGGACVTLAVAEREGVAFTIRYSRSGRELVTGAAPDGTARVRALAEDGATLAQATPRSSIYRLNARNIQRISLEGDSR